MKIATVKLLNGWMREFYITIAQVPKTDRDHGNEVTWTCGIG